MIRVLHIVASMNIGGLETFIMNIYRHINKERIQFDFLVHTKEKGSYDEEIEALGGHIYRIPNRRSGVLKNKIALNEFFRTNQLHSIVHMHESSLSYIEPLVAAKKYGKTTIIHAHSTSLAKKNKAYYFHKILHIFNKSRINMFADFKLACSRKSGEWMYGKCDTSVQIVNNCIDIKKYEFNDAVRGTIRTAMGLEDSFVIGHVGRFVHSKNQKMIIDIIDEILERKANIAVIFVGSGELEQEVKQLATDRGLNSVIHFLGERADVQTVLNAMDVFVFPSTYEGVPLTLIEAQANGLGCIVSNKVDEAVDITGKLKFLALEDIDIWVNALLKYEATDCLRRVESNLISKMASYDLENIVVFFEQLYLDNYIARK